MSPAQVQALFPDASPPEKAGTLLDGARCELAISPYEFSAHPYRVCFYFSDEKLQQVSLDSRDPPPSPEAFKALIGHLRSTHGPELGAGQPICNTAVGICNAVWALDSGTRVSVSLILIPMVPIVVNISYKPLAEPMMEPALPH